VREQADLLEAVSDVPAQLGPGELRRVASADQHAPGRRLDQAVDHLQRRGLAAARAAEQDQHLALGHLERQAVDGSGAVVALGEALQADQPCLPAGAE
jgi:hypothetical protein